MQLVHPLVAKTSKTDPSQSSIGVTLDRPAISARRVTPASMGARRGNQRTGQLRVGCHCPGALSQSRFPRLRRLSLKLLAFGATTRVLAAGTGRPERRDASPTAGSQVSRGIASDAVQARYARSPTIFLLGRSTGPFRTTEPEPPQQATSHFADDVPSMIVLASIEQRRGLGPIPLSLSVSGQDLTLC